MMKPNPIVDPEDFVYQEFAHGLSFTKDDVSDVKTAAIYDGCEETAVAGHERRAEVRPPELELDNMSVLQGAFDVSVYERFAVRRPRRRHAMHEKPVTALH